MQPTRRSQPYRDMPGRPAGPQLQAMLNGRTLQGQNPQDTERASALLAFAKQRQMPTAGRPLTILDRLRAMGVLR